MTFLKKSLSVFLAVLMLMTAFTVGFYGAAAEIDYTTQYRALADALRNEYVRELTNYTISNQKLDDETEGFNSDANGFAYEHRVTAADNNEGSILKAANRFYYIAESLISTKYGVGCYNPKTLLAQIEANLGEFFNTSETVYEDFYGNPYEPTDEQLKEYNDAVSLIKASDREVTQATLTQFNIYFMEKNSYEYYNVATLLEYFLGDVITINAGNWYHRFAFIVETSVNTCIIEADGIDNCYDNYFTLRTAAYQIGYTRTYNDTGSKAYYAFSAPSLENTVETYGREFGFTSVPTDLTANVTRNGQAKNLAVTVSYDETTIPYLNQLYATFAPYVEAPYDEENGSWDSQFASYTSEQLKNWATANNVVNYISDITDKYSNEALLSMFGENIGNMLTFAYMMLPSDIYPSRTVRGTATYEVTTAKLDNIVNNFDALITPEDDSESDIASRVATILSQFFDTTNDIFVGSSVYGMQFTSVNDLVSKLLNALVFRDSIVTKIVQLVYPMVATLIEDMVNGMSSAISGTVESILTNIISNNSLAIYPNTLGDRLLSVYGNKYSVTANILKKAGSDWTAVNFEALEWGVDSADIEVKDTAFIDAMCAGLCGFTKLIVTIMCGDLEYANSAREDYDGDHYTKYFDRDLYPFFNVNLWSQGAYTKLIVPLMRVLGLNEQNFISTDFKGYPSSGIYHTLVDRDEDNCLRAILEPIVYWATDILGAKPIETLMTLIPNLVNFLSRTSDVAIGDGGWTSASLPDDDGHANFTTVQSHNLWEIIDSIHIHVTVTMFNANAYNATLGSLLSKYQPMLTSINGILKELLKLEYTTDNLISNDTCAYSNSAGEVVLPDSAEYALNPENYPNTCILVYTDAQHSSYVLQQDETHTIEYTNPVYEKVSYSLPAIQEKKLLECGTVYQPSNYNTILVEHPGNVLLFLLRYVFSALGYKYDAAAEKLPMLVSCFGLDPDKTLFQGLTIGDIIYNIMLHPDEAICAVLELFFTNENGDYYTSKAYTYPMESVEYFSSTLMNPIINPTLTYGNQVRYSKFWTAEYANEVVNDADTLVTNILSMLGFTEFAGGIGGYLKNMLNTRLFTNSLMNKLFNTIYQLLAGLDTSLKIDISAVADAALGINYTPANIAAILRQMTGYESQATRAIASAQKWSDLFAEYTYDSQTGEVITTTVVDVNFDWGIDESVEHGVSQGEAFLRTASAILSPAALVFRFLLLDNDLDILGLIKLPAYAGYQYSFIALLEALSCPGVLTYTEYYDKSNTPVIGAANTIYYLFSPLLGLLDKVYADPINTILDIIPNLMFFVSIGGLNGILNNLVHFAYVLLDILKPVVNGYDLLNGLISNIQVAGVTINLTLPLDADFNGLISDLIGGLVGDALTIDGTSLKLPYIDFHTLCCGILEKFTSKEVRTTVRLDSTGGGDMLTAVLRIVFEVVFMDENKKSVSDLIAAKLGGNLDDYDKETILLILDKLFTMADEYDIPDMLMYVVYILATKLTPVSGLLAPKFQQAGITVQDFVGSLSDTDALMKNIKLLIGETQPSDSVSNITAIGSLFAKIKAFFEKLKLFFMNMFK